MPNPLILATWTYGRQACAGGWPHLVRDGGGALDAVEHACCAIETDPENMTVGRGGRPDASGEVTLDAAVMLSPARCGAVCCVRNFCHPTSLARQVMERTPHVMLAGDGAERFAREQGMEPAGLLTDAARTAWEAWRKQRCDADETPALKANIEEANHDTVGVLALDVGGTLAGACSTSGLAFKMPGRVGDSPIIGHGLYVDPARGAAVATGHGELVMGVCGTFLAVERMGQGASPAAAAEGVIRRIREVYRLEAQHQVGLITLAPSGRWSSAALRPGFRVAARTPDRDDLTAPEFVLLP